MSYTLIIRASLPCTFHLARASGFRSHQNDVEVRNILLYKYNMSDILASWEVRRLQNGYCWPGNRRGSNHIARLRIYFVV